MSSHKTRPTRSNSLQRMLELERRYMLERLQSAPPAAPIPVPPVASKTTSSSPARPSIQVRRIEGQAQKDAHKDTHKDTPKGVVAPREKLVIPRITPLAINVSSTKLQIDTSTESDREVLSDSSAPPNSVSPDKPSSKVVSFDVPPDDDEDDRRSICQSPSWEAYGRRKKEEKKEHKELKKEQKKEPKKEQKKDQKDPKKEQIEHKEQKEQKQQKREKDATGKVGFIRKKRLSKQPPPTSSPHALEQANRMILAAASAPSLEKPRPASALGLTSPVADDTSTARRPRSRSGSFTSLIRAPFESRRASVDATPLGESGFIGGIKLEIQRHAAYQKTIADPAKGDESDIHPALRAANSHNQKWSAPLKSPPPPSRPNGSDPQRRAYPPITRHGSSAKTRSLISPTAPDIPDIGTIEKWRAFVGLKSTPRQDTGAKNGPKFEGPGKLALPGEGGKSSSSSLPLSVQSLQIKGKTEGTSATGDALSEPAALHNSPRIAPQNGGKIEFDKPNGSTSTLASQRQLKPPAFIEQHVKAQGTAHVAFAETQHSKSEWDTRGDPEPKNHVAIPTIQKDSATINDLSRVPPSPPRRSSKRNSLLSLDGSVSSLSSPGEGPASRSPTRRPGSPGESIKSATETRHQPKPSPGLSPKLPLESHIVATTHVTQRESHLNLGKSSMDSAEFRNNELATSGASLRPSTPRENSPSEVNPDRASITTWEDIQTSVMHTIETKVSLSPIRKAHSFLRDDSDFTVRRLAEELPPPPRSPDDSSSSDDFHSPSAPGTPDTSRPQSEKGVPPPFPDIEKRLMTDEEPTIRHDSQSSVKEPASNKLEAVSSPANSTSDDPRLGNDASVAHATVIKVVTPVPVTQLPRLAVQQRPQPQANGVVETNFLPKLKHQPLKPVDKTTPRQSAPAAPRVPGDERLVVKGPASYLEEARKATPLAPPPQTLKVPQQAQFIPKVMPPPSIRSQPNSSATDPITKAVRHNPAAVVGIPGGEPIAKMFVECCGCKFYHDMPSNLYEAMANPESVIRPRGNVGSGGFAGTLSMTVKCPWCSHEMSTRCCAGYAAMVYVKEKLH